MAVFCVQSVIDQPGATGVVRQGRRQAAWTVHQVQSQNHTLLGHSPPARQAGRRVGPALFPSASLALPPTGHPS
jgi:hypothetical protein